MEMTYRAIPPTDEHTLAYIYERLRSEDLLWTVYPEVDPEEWTLERFYSIHQAPLHMLAGYIDGEMAGVMLSWPFRESWKTRVLEIGLTAFRKHFAQAVPLCRGALLWACDHLQPVQPTSFIGRVACPSHHILRLLDCLGFQKLGKVPGLCWYTRRQTHVDGWLVLATPESIKATVEVK